MRYLPIHVDTKDAQILIVGGEGAAEAKLRTLIKSDAHLHVVAPEISPEITRWLDKGLLKHSSRDFQASDLEGIRLVYAATEDDELNLEIGDLARSKGLLVNAADQKEACDFITPALVDRSPVIVSIGTEGTSPSLARAVKTDLEARLPSGLGTLALIINDLRARVKAAIPSLARRQLFWADIFDGKDLVSQLRVSGEGLTQRVEDKLEGHNKRKVGGVSLVGAGPGNPDLLTLAARQKLHSADVIVYDRLVSQGVLDFGRREAEYIYVGKEPGGKSTPQDEINAIIIKKALDGDTVIRLKSGDPLIFGRADEEIDALETAGISYDIVPGITSAASAAAEIGASLTTRGHNKAVSFLTGHDAKGFAEHDWKGLATGGARAAVYMGVGASGFIQGRLLMHGAEKDLPVTVVENASRESQIIVATTLERLAEDIKSNGIKGPAILLLGYKPRSIAEDSFKTEAAQ
ncbi:siroheme synthase CysG [Hellea balneolensis]|uniref:siroheme synthase CysG n=1 Tax=Hellea balneolensis TaxID=287478 RepID=UPI000423E411|nr:siroheme synthase CysG [Hellea balneolensis]